METLLLSADQPEAIGRAVDLLSAGETVALPTETVYGLAADASRPEAVAAIFLAKERPLFDPLIVHLPHQDWLARVANVLPEHRVTLAELLERFWPGPLTILLPRRAEAVPDLVTAGGELVALRMSAHPVFRQVIERFGRPLAAPSANRFGRISPTTGAHVLSELNGRIPLILDAGPTSHGLESTIIAFDHDGALRILRHGPITSEMLAEHLSTRTDPVAAAPAAPGQMPAHYAPRTRLTLLEPESAPSSQDARSPGRIGLLAFRRDEPAPKQDFTVIEYLSETGDLREAAARLFAALRRLDGAGLDRIYVRPVPEIGLGRAIMERLRRAAAGSGETE